MKDLNIVQKETRLIKFFWERGWVAMKGVPMGSEDIEYSYIVGMKRGRIFILSIQELPSGNSKKGVSDESKELEHIRSIVEPSVLTGNLDLEVGFAIAKGWDNQWRYAEHTNKQLRYGDSYERLEEVLMVSD